MPRTLGLRLFGLIALAFGWPAASGARTYANPMDLDYRKGFQVEDPDKAHRSGADPVFVRHKGAYYLFLTMTDGYWRSTVRWGIRPDRLTLTCQRFADQGTELELKSLNAGQEYFVAVEAFDENGVSRLTPGVRLR
jgi:hypothetical protein